MWLYFAAEPFSNEAVTDCSTSLEVFSSLTVLTLYYSILILY